MTAYYGFDGGLHTHKAEKSGRCAERKFVRNETKTGGKGTAEVAQDGLECGRDGPSRYAKQSYIHLPIRIHLPVYGVPKCSAPLLHHLGTEGRSNHLHRYPSLYQSYTHTHNIYKRTVAQISTGWLDGWCNFYPKTNTEPTIIRTVGRKS